MTTVAQIVDRVEREYLYAADDSPSFSLLTVAQASGATTLTYDTRLITADDAALIAPGIEVEVGYESQLVLEVDDVNGILTVQRGWRESTAVDHAIGELVRVAPTFTRRAAADAVADNVEALYPTLYHVATTTLTIARPFTEVPADVQMPLELRNADGRSFPIGAVDNFTASATGKAITTRFLAVGATAYLTYQGSFDRPTPMSDPTTADLVGVEPQWERIVTLGAAVQLLTGRDMETVTREFHSEALQSQTYPEGASRDKREGMYRIWLEWIRNARRELVDRYGLPLVRLEAGDFQEGYGEAGGY